MPNSGKRALPKNSINKIFIKKLTVRIPTVFIGHFGRYQAGILKLSDLPRPVILTAKETNEEFNFNLIEVLPISDAIPSVLAYHAEGKDSESCTAEILERTKTTHCNQLAYYLYEYQP